MNILKQTSEKFSDKHRHNYVCGYDGYVINLSKSLLSFAIEKALNQPS